MTARHPAQVRAAALAAIGCAEAGHDRHAAHGLIDGALVARIRRCQHDPFDVNFAPGEQVVDVPELGRNTILPGATGPGAPGSAVSTPARLTAGTAVAPAQVSPHAGPQAAGGAAGVHIRARREAKHAQPTDLHADRD